MHPHPHLCTGPHSSITHSPAQKQKPPSCQPKDDWTDTPWQVHTTKRDTAIKSSPVLTHTTIWVHLGNTVRRGRSRIQKATCGIYDCICVKCPEKAKRGELTARGSGDAGIGSDGRQTRFFSGDESVLVSESSHGCTTL